MQHFLEGASRDKSFEGDKGEVYAYSQPGFSSFKLATRQSKAALRTNRADGNLIDPHFAAYSFEDSH